MNKYERAHAILVLFLAVLFANSVATLIMNSLFHSESTPQAIVSTTGVVSEQPMARLHEETLQLDAARDALFDIDVSNEYKHGWNDCCKFLELINERK